MSTNTYIFKKLRGKFRLTPDLKYFLNSYELKSLAASLYLNFVFNLV